jgi:hypothetical protein
MVSLEVIPRKGFSKSVSNLIPGSHWEDLDEPISNMFAKMMVTHIDVLGTRTKLWKPSKFQCTGGILKNLAVYVGLGTNDLKTPLPNFLDQKHNGKSSCRD